MTESKVNISYNLDEFMNYKEINNVLPEELKKYCLSINNSPLNIRSELFFEMKNINKSILSGSDPNDIILKTEIRDNLNKISKTNFDEYIEKLINLNYSNPSNYEVLIYELIIRSMNDPIVIKGFNPTENDNYISNINSKICKYFTTNCKDPELFNSLLLTSCNSQFKDFLNENKHLDNNNKHRVDNYKGFMNFLGLLHNNKIIKDTIILSCLDLLKNLIYESDWDEYECANVFIGYDRLMNQLIFEIKNNLQNYKLDYIENIIKITKNIEFENNKIPKLRRIQMLTLNNILNNLNEIRKQKN